jgi:hypothetical protein
LNNKLRYVCAYRFGPAASDVEAVVTVPEARDISLAIKARSVGALVGPRASAHNSGLIAAEFEALGELVFVQAPLPDVADEVKRTERRHALGGTRQEQWCGRRSAVPTQFPRDRGAVRITGSRALLPFPFDRQANLITNRSDAQPATERHSIIPRDVVGRTVACWWQ